MLNNMRNVIVGITTSQKYKCTCVSRVRKGSYNRPDQQGFANSRNSRKGSHDSSLPLGVARTPPEKTSSYKQQGCLTLLDKVASLKQRVSNLLRVARCEPRDSWYNCLYTLAKG